MHEGVLLACGEYLTTWLSRASFPCLCTKRLPIPFHHIYTCSLLTPEMSLRTRIRTSMSTTRCTSSCLQIKFGRGKGIEANKDSGDMQIQGRKERQRIWSWKKGEIGGKGGKRSETEKERKRVKDEEKKERKKERRTHFIWKYISLRTRIRTSMSTKRCTSVVSSDQVWERERDRSE